MNQIFKMSRNRTTVIARKLLSDSFHLAMASCQVVKDFYEKNVHFKQYAKSQEDDIVTEADYKVQSMIINGLRTNFPELRIIGEQQVEYKGEIQFNSQKLNNDTFPLNFEIKEELPNNMLCAWIDPIDSTKSLIDGNIENVSVLIGFSLNKTANLGLIAVPYRAIGKQKVYDPFVYVGSMGSQIAYEFNLNSKNKWTKMNTKLNLPEQGLRMTVGNTPRQQLQTLFKNQLNRENIRVGGAGNKIAMVLGQRSCVSVSAPGWTRKWDTCAGQAIVRSIGGHFSDRYGNQIQYDPDGTDLNKQGIICALNEKIFKESLKAYNQYL